MAQAIKCSIRKILKSDAYYKDSPELIGKKGTFFPEHFKNGYYSGTFYFDCPIQIGGGMVNDCVYFRGIKFLLNDVEVLED